MAIADAPGAGGAPDAVLENEDWLGAYLKAAKAAEKAERQQSRESKEKDDRRRSWAGTIPPPEELLKDAVKSPKSPVNGGDGVGGGGHGRTVLSSLKRRLSLALGGEERPYKAVQSLSRPPGKWSSGKISQELTGVSPRKKFGTVSYACEADYLAAQLGATAAPLKQPTAGEGRAPPPPAVPDHGGHAAGDAATRRDAESPTRADGGESASAHASPRAGQQGGKGSPGVDAAGGACGSGRASPAGHLAGYQRSRRHLAGAERPKSFSVRGGAPTKEELARFSSDDAQLAPADVAALQAAISEAAERSPTKAVGGGGSEAIDRAMPLPEGGHKRGSHQWKSKLGKWLARSFH